MGGTDCLRGHMPNDKTCGIFHMNELLVKTAILKVCESVVSVVTYDLPDDMLQYRRGHRLMIPKQYPENDAFFWGSGTIIDCCDTGDTTYSATILTAANLFRRTNDLKPEDINVEVYLSDGQQVEAELKCCDFHFNLAVLIVRSSLKLPVAKLKCLDDVLPIDNIELLQLQQRQSFQLRPHSESVKIFPGELVIALGRFYTSEFSLEITPGYFSEKQSYHDYDCKQLYMAHCCTRIAEDGGPVINCQGDVIGVRFQNYDGSIPFLPSNVALLWWNQFQKFGEFRRPWVGMDVCNLHEAELDVLRKFPNIGTGVMVTKILKDSPAKCARIRRHDVIFQCDGISVGSTLEFFEKIWHKTGESIEVAIVRAGKSSPLKCTMTIGETVPDNFHDWLLPVWDHRPDGGCMDESSDKDDDEDDDSDDDGDEDDQDDEMDD